MKAEGFLHGQPIYIFLLWLVAFCFRSSGGIIYIVFLNEEVKILIGSAGVSVVPMAARVSQRVGQQVDACHGA